MSDTLEQAKERVLQLLSIPYSVPSDEEAVDALIAAVRAEAQREAFEAGYLEGFGTNNAETLDAKRAEAFAAYLTRQAGQT